MEENTLNTPVQPKPNAPYGVAALVLGICSIVSSCFMVGLVLGIIGLVLSSKGYKEYYLDPARYKNEGMLKAGKILSIIGIVLGGMYVLYIVAVALIVGASIGMAGGTEGITELVEALSELN